MKRLVLLILAVVVLGTGIIVLTQNSESRINRHIKAANYCEITSDCAVVSYGCPFGCLNYVNNSEHKNLLQEISEAEIPHCMYVCSGMDFLAYFPVCENGKCVKANDSSKVFEQNSCKKIKRWMQERIEIVTGYCEEDNDCTAANKAGLASEFSCGLAVNNRSQKFVALTNEYAKKCGTVKIKCQDGDDTKCINNVCVIK
jgi:hypothetical protein